MSDETFEVEAEVKHATAKAILVLLETGEERWIPKAIIHDDSEVYDEGHEGTLIVPAWWARKEKLL